MGQQTILTPLDEAKRIARSHNMFVAVKGGRFLLYRCMPNRNVLIGTRGTDKDLLGLVRHSAGSR